MHRIVPAFALVLLNALGCVPTGPPTLVVATDWPEAECRAQEALVLQQWKDGPAPRIVWLRSAQGETGPGLIERGAIADVVLGGPIGCYARLVRLGLFRDGAYKQVVRSRSVVLAEDNAVLEGRALEATERIAALAQPAFTGLVALDDPRRSAVTRSWALGVLQKASEPNTMPTWGDQYAVLAYAAADALPISAGPRAARSRLERAGVAFAPVEELREGWSALEPARSIEGAAVLEGSPRAEEASRFLDLLAAASKEEIATLPSLMSDELTIDLLGATLVDAQPELVRARSALNARPPDRRSRELAGYLIEPPPWPPSAAAELNKEGRSGESAALAAQIFPGLGPQGWLQDNWEKPQRPLTQQSLEAIARTEDGKLVAEPRFRAWLRAEWSAWVRQRYRRVGREAEKASPSP